MRWFAISSMSASWSLSSLAPSGESLAARRSLILWYSLYLSWSIATWWWWPWSASPSCSSGSLESPRLELLVCISFICSSFRVDYELLSSLFRLLPFPLAPAFVALIESRICCWAWTDSELSCMEGAATTPAAVWLVLAYLKMVYKMVWLSSSCVPPGYDAWLLVLEINASIWEYRSTGGHWLEFGLLSPGWEFILALWVEACVGTLLVKFVELIFWSGLVIFKLRIRWLDPSIYPSESTCWVLLHNWLDLVKYKIKFWIQFVLLNFWNLCYLQTVRSLVVPCISNLVLDSWLVLLQYRLEVGKSGISMDQASLIRGSGISQRINVTEWTWGCIRIIRAPAFRFFYLVGCQDRCRMPL